MHSDRSFSFSLHNGAQSYNKRFVYTRPEIMSLLKSKNVLVFEADLTHDTPDTRATEAFMRKTGGQAVPHAVLFHPAQRHAPTRFSGLVDAAALQRALSALP